MQAFAVIVADYLKVHCSIPVHVHTDDGAFGAPDFVPNHGRCDSLSETDRFRVTCNTACIVLVTFQKAGWCIGLAKSNLLPEPSKKHLGLLVHCPTTSHRIPSDKRVKHQSLLAPLCLTPLGDPQSPLALHDFAFVSGILDLPREGMPRTQGAKQVLSQSARGDSQGRTFPADAAHFETLALFAASVG